jgi:hypothetical protein
LCSPILAPGTYTLSVSAPECGARVATVQLAAGEHRELGAFALASWIVLRGRVLDASGAPIAASIRLRDESSPAREDTLILGAHSESDGTFTTQLPPGRWLFEFTGGGVEQDARHERGELGALRRYDSARGPLENEVVELAATTSVRLFPRPGLEPPVEYEVRAGEVVLRRGVLRLLPMTLRLVPGSYMLLVRDGLGRVLRDEPMIVGAEAVEVEIRE